MYPRVPPAPTGRASLEWYQISAMRHHNPAMLTSGEFGDVWDKFTNPNEDTFLDREDYQKILAELNSNIAAKGEGKRNVNWRAINHPNDERDTDSDPGAASSRDAPSAARAAMHPYLHDKGKDKGKGKTGRALHREAWNRRSRPRGLRVDDAWRSAGAETAAQNLDDSVDQPASEHPSMPELLENINEEENEESEDADDDDQSVHLERS